MATYFIGAGLETYDHSPTLVYDQGSSIQLTGTFGQSYADCHLVDPATGLRTPQTSLWFHAVIGGRQGFNGGTIVAFVNSAGRDVLRICSGGDIDTSLVRRLLGGAYVDITNVLWTRNNVWDVRIVVHPTAGRISVNVSGTNWINLEGIDTSEFVDIAKVRFTQGGYESTILDQVIIASYNTIGHTVRRRVPSSDASITGWTGSYADIDEPVNNDADSINTSIVGGKATFDAAPLGPVSTGNVVKAVAVSARIRNDGGDVPRNAAAVLTLDGVDYAKPYNLVVGPGFSGASTIFDVNPATGQKWGDVIDPVNQPFGLLATE